MGIQSFIVGSYLKKRDRIISAEISSLMTLRERIAVCSVRQANITNKLCGRNIVQFKVKVSNTRRFQCALEG
jgi:hypothetical protein